MGLLFNNYLDDGFYEEDSYGTLTKITDPKKIIEAQQNGTLYENDGIATTKVRKDEDIVTTIKH
jgi:capsid portal protein